jgi:hypothetical protein
MLDEKEKNEYLKDDGLVLVDKYVKQMQLFDEQAEKLEGMQEEIDRIKEGLISYAKKKDLQVVNGKQYKVKIKIEDKSRLPGKNDEGIDKLEEVVRKSGKWDDVSDISTTSILKQYLDWGDELVKKIKKFITKVHKETVSKPYVREEEEE